MAWRPTLVLHHAGDHKDPKSANLRAAGVADAVIADRRRRRLEAAGGTAKVRHSGVQLEVLSLYKALLKEAARRTDPAARARLGDYIRCEFRKNGALAKKEVQLIEWHLHYGRNKLEELMAQKASTGFTVAR